MPSNATLTNLLAGKLAPVTVIEVPTGPDTWLRAIEASGATVNGAESVPVPAAAAIVWAPAADAGTVMAVEKVPVLVVVTVAGVVVTMAPSYFIVTAVLAG